MQGMYLEQKDVRNEDLLRFPDSNSDAVISEIKRFWGLRKKFQESKVSHKRGLLLYGPPGSGKTCTLRIVVEDLVGNQNGIVLEWPGGGPDMLLEAYGMVRGIHPDMPIVVLMEDVDAILEGYSNSKTLNLLDGVQNIDRILFLATTNHPEKLGSRIVNRPSRFDKRFLIGMPNAEARGMFLEHKGILGDELKQWVSDTDGMSIAHLKELYVANKILGDDYGSAVATIKEMKFIPSSQFFDETKPMTERQALKYKDYGEGRVYAESKSRRGGMIVESKQQAGRSGVRPKQNNPWSVDSIAEYMTEE